MTGQLSSDELSAVVDPGPLERTLGVLELCRIQYRLLAMANGRIVICMKPLPKPTSKP